MKKSNETPADMNPDEFEQQISRHLVRPIPAEWREEILDAARNAATVSAKVRQEKLSFTSRLSEIFWPCPQAWAGLAAVWVAIAVFNHVSVNRESERMEMAKSPAVPLEMTLAVKQQQREFAQLLQGLDEPVAEPPKPFVPRPRSDCRTQIGWA